MKDNATIQVGFGTHEVLVTVGQIRKWHDAPQYIDEMRAAFKVDAHRDTLLDLVHSIADQTPGCMLFDCTSCGAQTYGAEGVIGPELCESCYELAGMDNEINDRGTPITESERDAVSYLIDDIRAAGGDGFRALQDCDFLQV